MSAYRFSLSIVSRGRGHNAVAKAAYRSGTRLIDLTGDVHDYRRRRRTDVAFSAVLAPEHAPEELRDRQPLWATVEAIERHPRAQLAEEFQANLPHELTDEERSELVLTFARDAYVNKGRVIDLNIHRPDELGDPRNYHVHGMSPLRPVEQDGFGAKPRPKFGRYKRASFLMERDRIHELRELFAHACNRALERAGLDVRVDHRSYATRGIDRAPQPKLGPLATTLERAGYRTRAGDDVRTVKTHNRERERREKDLDRSQDDLRKATEPNEAFFPDASQHVRLREAVLSEAYGRDMAGTTLAKNWTIERTADGLRFRSRAGELHDFGHRIQAGKGTDAEISGLIELARAKGWGELEFRGTEDFKRAAYRAALREGFALKASGRDATLLERVRQEILEYDRVPATAGRDQSADRSRGRAGATPPAPHLLDEETKIARILDEATFDKPVFTRRLLDRVGAKYVENPLQLADLVARTLDHPSVKSVGESRRGIPFYTTTHVIGLEQQMLDDVGALVALKKFPVNLDRLEALIKERADVGRFSETQAAGLRAIAEPGAFVALVGYAGAGKSDMLQMYRTVAEEAGYNVHGAALAAKAVRNLKDLNVDGRTVASWLHRLRSPDGIEPPRETLTSRDVLILDEAGMVGTPQFAELARLCNEAGAKLIAVGDPGQLQPIQGGGAFAALINRYGAARLTEIFRQELDPTDKNPAWMRDASKLFGDGQAIAALKMYDERGRVLGFETRDHARAELIDRWARDRAEHPGEGQLILASMHVDIKDLNRRAREHLHTLGEIGADVVIDTPKGQKLPAGPKTFAVGDRVYFLDNERTTYNVDNGSMGTVDGIRGSTLSITLDETPPRKVAIDLQKYPDITHGYAVVIHKSQGSTIRRTYTLASTFLDSELAYVGQTRHTKDANFYWSTDVFGDKAQLYRIVGRSAQKGTALDHDIEREAPSGHYLRTPVQLERDVKQMLDTAKELHRSATEEQRPAADRALAHVVGVHDRLAFNIEQLKSGSVATVQVASHSGRYTDRITALEAALAGALEGMLRGGPEVTEELDRSAVAPAAVPTEPLVVPSGETLVKEEPPRERAPDLPPPTGAVSLRALDPALADRAAAALDSPNYLDKLSGLLVTTGRYSAELLTLGKFEPGVSQSALLFSGQAKARDTGRADMVYEIPVLAEPQKVLDAIASVRAERDFASMTPKEINASIGKSLGAAVRRNFGDDFVPREMRSAYAALAYAKHAHEGENRMDFAARVLFHDPFDVKTALAYTKMTVAGQEVETIRDFEAGAAERIETLRAAIEDYREHGREHMAQHGVFPEDVTREIGYLDERLALLQATSWFAPVRAEEQVLTAPEIQTVLDQARAEQQANLTRAKALEAALPPLPALPQHPDQALAAQVRQIRDEAQQKGQFTARELDRIRELEQKGDTRSLGRAGSIRQARAAERELALTEAKDKVRALEAPASRAKLMNEYANQVAVHRDVADRREQVTSQVRAIESEVTRLDGLAKDVREISAQSKADAPYTVTVKPVPGESRVDQIAQVVEQQRAATVARER